MGFSVDMNRWQMNDFPPKISGASMVIFIDIGFLIFTNCGGYPKDYRGRVNTDFGEVDQNLQTMDNLFLWMGYSPS